VLPGFWLPGYVSIEMRADNGRRSGSEEIGNEGTRNTEYGIRNAGVGLDRPGDRADAPYSVLRVPCSVFPHFLFAISYFLVTRPYGG
jgi:hypothetical protein